MKMSWDVVPRGTNSEWEAEWGMVGHDGGGVVYGRNLSD